MAEGLLGGILGEAAEQPELAGPEPLAGSEACAAAVARKLAGNDPQVARDTPAFLQEQAQRAYAEAVALAPDLPAAYYSWGLALARHGDLSSAEAKLKGANQRGPHWADPLKA